MEPVEARTEEFRTWLESNTSLGSRSIRDVVSRTKRVVRILDPLEPSSRDELRFVLSTHPEVKSCSATVRSQLKRAALLYREFRGAQEGKA